jgi:transcriptional regulator with XRE-family HTH domain
MKTLGERLRERREELDLSLRELARQVACSPPFLSDIEHGRRFPSESVFGEIARVLRLDPEELRHLDPRAPVEELRRMTERDPNYAVAFRTMVEKAPSANDLIAFLNSKPSEKGQKK